MSINHDDYVRTQLNDVALYVLAYLFDPPIKTKSEHDAIQEQLVQDLFDIVQVAIASHRGSGE